MDGTVARLLAQEHRRVLEVGCGTGLLLFRVAPHAERYRGSDFSAVALAQVRAGLDRLPLPQVELAQGLADDWAGVRPGDFDLIVLNSIIQYFPGVEYLVTVLEGAVAAVAPGGAVFVGDVRSLPLLQAFHASVELHRAAGSLPAAELAERVKRRVAEEEELVIDPAFFPALARRLPGVRRVEVLLKRGRRDNELTRFRYDVILHVGGEGVAGEAPSARTWESLAEVERLLAERPDALAVRGIPSSRLASEAEAVNPEDLWALAERLGYDADLTWSAGGGADGRFDAVLRRRGSGVLPGVAPEAAGTAEADWSQYANDPLRAGQERRLVPELRRFLAAELPDAMMPAAFVLLPALPLTASGKVDRRALPAPERTLAPAGEWEAPATPLEELLAREVAGLLGLERVGMRDNFFALGGHSLLATQLVSRLTQEQGIEVTLRMVFDAADLGELADRIVEQEILSADAGLLDAAWSEMEELSSGDLQTLPAPADVEGAR